MHQCLYKISFSKDFKVPQIRFCGFDGIWIYNKLKNISQKITQKNSDGKIKLVLSNSAENGLISQNDFFDKDIANEQNSFRYFIIKKGDFVYNPRKSSFAPWGPINMLDKYSVGIVSPLYTCFRINDVALIKYLSWYFKSSKWYRYIYLNGDNGARGDRVGIKDAMFFDMPIYIPPKLTECVRISELFELLEKKISLLDAKIKILKKYKKGIILRLIKTGFLASAIKDLVKVEKKTGLASSHGKEFGLYPFFINNDEGVAKYCDEYVFDNQHLILNTGGTASVKYYDGKFSAMSDCLILKPIAHAIGLYYFLLANEKKINIAGFQGTGLKHLDQKWFFNLKVRLPNLSDAELNKLNKLTEYQIQNLTKKAKLMKSLKQYLLVNMFI